MKKVKTGVAMGVVLALGACGGQDGGNGDWFEVVDSAGVEVVRNHYAGFDTMAVRLVEDLRIGVVEGDERLQFFRILGITVDSLDRILVANLGTSSIRIFDEEGEFVREVGKRGEGPGEFRGVTTPIVWGDTLGVADMEAMRFSVFDTAGMFLDSWPMLNTENRALFPVGKSPDGWTTWMMRFGVPPAERRPGEITIDSTRMATMPTGVLREAARRGTGYADSVATGPYFWESPPVTWVASSEGSVGYSPMFDADRSWTVDGHGRFVLKIAPDYRIDFFGADGRLERQVTRDFERIPITDAMVDDFIARYEAAMRAEPPSPFDRVGQARRHAAASRADFMAPAGRIVVSSEGELWVERLDIHRTLDLYAYMPGYSRSVFYFDVFDADGRYRFTLRMPDRFTPRWVRGDTVIGVLRDEDDVEYVVRYRLEPHTAER